MRASHQLGRDGEQIAADHLESLGYELIDRNWRSGDRAHPGELDIVARDGTCIVFCEVKTRRSVVAGYPEDAVTADKLGRLRRLARLWLRAHDLHAPSIRIDVISVLMTAGAPQLRHLRNVTA